MPDDFRREYLVRLPLPLAQLYGRAYNAKDGRARHDNSFYCFEALIKLAACPLIASYAKELEDGAARNEKLDNLLSQIALPSLGQWVGFLRETARYFGTRADSGTHPMGHVWNQLNEKHRNLPGMLALYRRIKNGPDAKEGGDQSCSVLQLLESLVQYRNLVFGHGAGRAESFYEDEMGPLLFPALNDIFCDGVFDFLGTGDSRLVYLTDLSKVDQATWKLEWKELVGTQSTRLKPVSIDTNSAAGLSPFTVAVMWPSRSTPTGLQPLLSYREDDFVEEVLFINRDRNKKAVEFLSYTTGRTEKDSAMAPTMAAMLTTVSGQRMTEESLGHLQMASLKADAENSAAAVAVASPAASSAGRLIRGDFEVIAEIGRGGMGVVYLAKQLSLGRPVALKMLHPSMAGDDDALARFKREVSTLARCDHPNIVKVLSAGKMPDGEYYYAMEYVSGSDLELVWSHLADRDIGGATTKMNATDWAKAVLDASTKKRTIIAEGTTSVASRKNDTTLEDQSTGDTTGAENGDVEQGPLSLHGFDVQSLPQAVRPFDESSKYTHQIARMIRDAADGLQALHDRDIVHRDIKPSNMVLTADGSRVVLMDFGLAKGANQSMAATRAGGFMGTMRYAAPEQLAAATMRVGPQADIRGLGVTMWELLTRQRLFDDLDDEMQLAQAIIHRDVPLLRSIDPTIERDLEAIVARATERQLSDRIESARQLVDLLDLYLEGKSLPIRSPSHGELIRRRIRAVSMPVKALAATAALLFVFAGAMVYRHVSSLATADNQAAATAPGHLEVLTLSSFSGSSWLEHAPWLLPQLRQHVSAQLSRTKGVTNEVDGRYVAMKPATDWSATPDATSQIMRSSDIESVLSHLKNGLELHLHDADGETIELLEFLQSWNPNEIIEDPEERLAVKDTIIRGLKSLDDPHALAVYAAHFDKANLETGVDPDAEFRRAEELYKSKGEAAKGLLALCYADWGRYLTRRGTHDSRKQAAGKFSKARETINDEKLAPIFFAECYCGEANATRKLKDYERTEQCLRKAEEITAANADPHHPLAAYIQERLAWQYMDQWKVMPARAAFRTAIAIWEYWDEQLKSSEDKSKDLQLAVSTSRFADEHGLAMVERYLGHNNEAIRRYNQLPSQIRKLRNEQSNAGARLKLSMRLVNTKERLADCSLLQPNPQPKAAALNYEQVIRNDYPASQRGNQIQEPATILGYKLAIASILKIKPDQADAQEKLNKLARDLDDIEEELTVYEQKRQELTGKPQERDHLLEIYGQSAKLLLMLASKHDAAALQSLRELVDEEIKKNSDENLSRDNLDLLLFLSDRILAESMLPEDASRPFKLVREQWRINVLKYLRGYHDRALTALIEGESDDLSMLADHISKAKTGQPLDDLNQPMIIFYGKDLPGDESVVDTALVHHPDGTDKIVTLSPAFVINSETPKNSPAWPEELNLDTSGETVAVHWYDKVTGLNQDNFPWQSSLPENYQLMEDPSVHEADVESTALVR